MPMYMYCSKEGNSRTKQLEISTFHQSRRKLYFALNFVTGQTFSFENLAGKWLKKLTFQKTYTDIEMLFPLR